jgi:hypothetical protein
MTDKEFQREIKRLRSMLEEQVITREVEKQKYKKSVTQFKNKIRVLRQKSPIHTPGRSLNKSRSSTISEFSPEMLRNCKCSEEYLEMIEEMERSLIEKQAGSTEYINSLKKSIALQDAQIEQQRNEMKRLVQKFGREIEEFRNQERFRSMSNIEVKVEEIIRIKEQEITELKDKHTKEIKQIKHTHEQTIQQIEQKHRMETEFLIKSHREIQEENKAEHSKELESMNLKFQNELISHQNHYEDKMKRMIDQLNGRIHCIPKPESGHPLIEFENISQIALNTSDSVSIPPTHRALNSLEQTRMNFFNRRSESSNREWNKALVNLLLRHSLIQ